MKRATVPSKAPATTRATVRTYRHGLGDCHLVTLHGKGQAAYRILIDCGVILGTPDAKARMTKVMDDINAESHNHVDLLVATHEHWDHVSGFAQAAESFDKLAVDAVWLAWTENPKDKAAQQLQGDKSQSLKLLQDAALHMQRFGAENDSLLASLLEFHGMAANATTKSALEAVRAKAAVRYCDPKDPPVELAGFNARIYVLGPPRDVALLKRVDPSAKAPETYKLALDNFKASVASAVSGADDGAPFSPLYQIPWDQARQQPFFQETYFGAETWRLIDTDWMGGADQLALALDNMTNNTSLVLAIELEGRGVLLFAADAQVGNWLSWGDCKWEVDGKTVTGGDLLARTILYKVGHHGSVNATLKEKGLELMTRLETAVIPVDHDMALKKRWGAMPLEPLLDALAAATAHRGGVLRTDKPLPPGSDGARVIATADYFEIVVGS